MWSKRLHSASDTDHLRYEKVSLSRIQPTTIVYEYWVLRFLIIVFSDESNVFPHFSYDQLFNIVDPELFSAKSSFNTHTKPMFSELGLSNLPQLRYKERR